jgi:hypothetical protein
MKRNYLFLAAALIPLVFVAMALLTIDEPRYQVVEEADGFELREYLPFLVAETRVEGSFSGSADDAFDLLVDYVQGNNVGGRVIPMTAPVRQQPANASNGGAVPVSAADAESDSWLFQFALPKEYQMSMLPRPLDERVDLRRLEPGLVAALRYGGDWSETRYRAKERELLDAVRSAGLTTVGTPSFARYNAVLIPWFLRRNEVLVGVDRR